MTSMSRTQQMLSRQRRASAAPGSRPVAALHDPGKTTRHYEEPPPDVDEEVAMAQQTGQMGASMLMGDPRLKQQLAALKRKSEKPTCSAMIGSAGGSSSAASSPRASRNGPDAPNSAKVVGQMSAKEVAEYLEQHDLLQLVNACANEAVLANAPNPLLFMATALREKTGRSAPVGDAAPPARAGTPTSDVAKQQHKPTGAEDDVKWFYVDTKRQKVGPLSWEELVTLHDEEKIELKTLVWTESLPQWYAQARSPTSRKIASPYVCVCVCVCVCARPLQDAAG